MKTSVKHRLIRLLAAAGILSTITHHPSTSLAQGTAFGYQGRLSDTGQFANGTYDLRFAIYDASNGGTLIAGPYTNSTTPVSDGLFSVTLDFGAGAFTGPARWLEVAAHTNGPSAFITLSPRQNILPAPYSMMATAASNLLGTLPAAQLSGTVPSSQFAGTYSGQLIFNNPLNHFCGDGGCLSNVNASTVGGLPASDFWQLTGNAGTSAGLNFLGTSDNNSLVVKVNNATAVRYDPAPYAPNIVAGLSAIKPTVIGTNVSGAVVAGGGAPSAPVTGFGAGDYHWVYDNDCTIGGGFGNGVGTDDGDPTDAAFATVAGGVFNRAANYAATVAGGDANNASGQRAAVLGGFANAAAGSLSAIGGGFYNVVQSNAPYSLVAGGAYNALEDSYTTIGGGTYNTIQGVSSNSTIAGGLGNMILATYASVGGGWSNLVADGCSASTIGGGVLNINGAYDCTIAGGNRNTIQAGSHDSTIGGGYVNIIQASSDTGTIAGGAGNNIGANSPWSTIAGGLNSSIQPGSISATIGGGLQNQIQTNSSYATLSGGYNNVAGGQYATVAGGYENFATKVAATVPGGYYNVASGQSSFAAGSYANATNEGAFVWSDSTLTPTYSSASNSVTFRASGGYRFFTGTGVVGAKLDPGATSWSTISDRNAKKNIETLDYQAVLSKLANIPVAQWNYNWESDDAVPHIGPMAQDFKQAFYPGRDDKSISTLEFDGVELAAIQALNQKLDAQLKAQAAQIQEKDLQIRSLEQRLQRLEQNAPGNR